MRKKKLIRRLCGSMKAQTHTKGERKNEKKSNDNYGPK